MLDLKNKKINNCLCYFTKKIMIEPVVASDSYTYEKELLLNLFDKYKKLNMPFYSPITNELMEESYSENLYIKQTINEIEDHYSNDPLVQEMVSRRMKKKNEEINNEERKNIRKNIRKNRRKNEEKMKKKSLKKNTTNISNFFKIY